MIGRESFHPGSCIFLSPHLSVGFFHLFSLTYLPRAFREGLTEPGRWYSVKLEAYHPAGAQPIESGAGWLLADPKLIEHESGKVRFAPDGPAAELKIEAIDVSDAGCTSLEETRR